MKFEIRHFIKYEYSEAVKLQPQLIYLHPRQSYGQYVLDYHLQIDPKPVFISRNYDLGGNIQQIAFFENTTNSLIFESCYTIVTPVSNGFDFLYFPLLSDTFPVDYGKDQVIANAYLNHSNERSLIEICQKLLRQSQGSISQFLRILNEWIHDKFKYESRTIGNAQNAEETLQKGMGSCRDFAVFFVEICRMAGLASRFVSGYFYEAKRTVYDLHAWAEVLLPGGGWRGFDPTHNITVGEKHVTLATSALSSNIYPVNGFYSGNAHQKMVFEIQIKTIE